MDLLLSCLTYGIQIRINVNIHRISLLCNFIGNKCFQKWWKSDYFLLYNFLEDFANRKNHVNIFEELSHSSSTKHICDFLITCWKIHVIICTASKNSSVYHSATWTQRDSLRKLNENVFIFLRWSKSSLPLNLYRNNLSKISYLLIKHTINHYKYMYI